MRVQIKDLKPNPFRDIKNYPIDKHKVQSLVNSITETGFWDNILARKVNGEFQIAYGHHRLLAVEKALGLKEAVDIPVKALSDDQMLQIMAEENNDYYAVSVKIIDETIRQVKKYLESHLDVAAKYGDLTKQHEYSREHSSIGAVIISRFLGKNWERTKVTAALKRLKLVDEGVLDKESVEKMPHPKAARDFTKLVEKEKLPIEKQKKVAEKIEKREQRRCSKDDIEAEVLVEKYDLDKKLPQKKSKEEVEIDNLVVDLEAIFRQSSALRNKLIRFLSDLRKYKIEQLSGLNVLIGEYDLAGLAKEMVRLAEYFHKNKREDTCQPQKLLNV